MKSGRHHHVKKMWEYTYPKIQGKVQNPAITKFQIGLLNLKEANTGRVVHDFKRNRGYTLNGEVFFNSEISDAELAKKFEEFVITANGYNPEDRDTLVNYLRTRGGQDSNFIIQELIRDNHFTDDPFKGDSSTSQNVLCSNWRVNKDGKIELKYCTEILSIEVKTPDENGEIVSLIADNQNKISRHHMGEEEFLTRKNNGLIPLMEIQYKMVLEMKDGLLIPTISHLHVTGFNTNLHVHKDKLTDKRDRRAASVAQLLEKIRLNIEFFSDDPDIQKHFEKIRHLIVQSNYGENMQFIKLAGKYIENIPCHIKSMFAFKTNEMPAIRLLSKNKDFCNACNSCFGNAFLSTLENEDITEQLAEQGISGIGHITNQEYSNDEICHELGITYHDLQILLHFYQPTYSCNAVNSAICEAWTDELQRSDYPENAAFAAFRQGFRINHNDIDAKSSDRNIKYTIEDFCKLAKTQNQIQRNDLYEWISKLGGSQCEKLVEMLINSSEINLDLPTVLRDSQTKLHFKPHFENPVHTWGQALDGSLELTSVYYVTSLFCESEKLAIIKNIHNNQFMFVESSKELLDGKRPPLMRVETKITLSIENDNVVTIVKAINTESYSTNLRPANLEENVTQHNKL